jgi:hypothetical protein
LRALDRTSVRFRSFGKEEEAAQGGLFLVKCVAYSSSPPWRLFTRYLFVPGIRMNCAPAGAEKPS